MTNATLNKTTAAALNRLARLCSDYSHPTNKKGFGPLTKAGLIECYGTHTYSDGQCGSAARRATYRIVYHRASPTDAGRSVYGALVAAIAFAGVRANP